MASEEGPKRLRRARRGAGNVATAFVSLLVVFVLAAYVGLGSSERATASVATVWMTRGHGEVLYGKVLGSTRRPLKGSVITVQQVGSTRVDGRAFTNRVGLYRLVLRVRAGTYTITIHKGRGSAYGVRGSVRHRLAPGMHLEVVGRLLHSDTFLTVPVFNY